MLSLVSYLLIIVLCKAVSAQTRGHFINPPDAGQPLLFSENVELRVGNTFQARWSTTLTEYTVYLWQQSLSIGSGVLGLPVYTKIAGGPEPGGFNWTVTQQAFDLSQSNVFFFALGPTQDITASTVTSHYFNVTMRSVTTSSASSAAATSSTSVSRSNTGITTSTSSATSTSVTSSTSQPAGSTGASAASNSTGDSSSNAAALKIGLGAGIPAGVLVLLLGLYLLGVLRRRRPQNKIQTASPPSTSYPIVVHMDAHKQMPPQYPQAHAPPYHMMPPPSEKWASGPVVVAELSSDGSARR